MSRAYIEICVLPFSLRLLAMAQFESASDDVLRQTAAWTAKHMRAMDWVVRHDLWDRFLENKSKRGPLRARRAARRHRDGLRSGGHHRDELQAQAADEH
jgi:hypothetical protein